MSLTREYIKVYGELPTDCDLEVYEMEWSQGKALVRCNICGSTTRRSDLSKHKKTKTCQSKLHEEDMK